MFDDYYRDTCAITKQNMIAFLQENARYSLKDSIGNCSASVQIFVGEKGNRAMQSSAKIIHEQIPGSCLKILPGLYHGEFSINHAEQYVQAIHQAVK